MKVDIKYIIKGGFWLLSGQGISMLISFVLSIVFAHFLTQEDYGIYKYILSIVGAVIAFTLTGLNAAITQSVSKNNEGIVRKALKVNLQWNSFLSIILIAGVVYYYINDNLTLSLSLLMAGVYIILNSFSLYGPFLNGRKNFKASSFFSTFRTLITSCVIILTILVTQNPLFITSAYFLSSGLTALIFYLYVTKRFKPNDNPSPGTLRYGAHLSFLSTIGDLASRVDSLLIFHFIGSAELAIYAFASAIPDQMIGVFKNMYFLALPRFSQYSTSALKKSFVSKVVLVGIVSLSIYVVYWFTADVIYTYIYPRYIESIYYTKIIGLNIVLAAIGILPATFFESRMEKKIKYIITSSTAVIKISLMLILLSFYGILGIIIAELIARVISLCISFTFMYRYK